MNDIFVIQTESFILSQSDFLIRMLISVGIGLVIGLEREFATANNKEIFAGLRTLSVVALLGFTCALLNFIIHPWFFVFGLLSVVILVAIFYWVSANKGDIGSTSEFTTIFTYLLGGLILLGNIEISLALTVVIVVLLSLKGKFRFIVGQITQEEIYAFVRFVVIALLILPFLPNEIFGYFQVLNPREIGWIIVLVSGIQFLGYILSKFLGNKKGIILTGIFGGLVSSTIVTWTFSKKSKENPSYSDSYALAIFSAATVMVIRVVVLVYIFNKLMLSNLLLPLFLVFLTAVTVTFIFFKKQQINKSFKEKIKLGNPLSIKDAVFFGFLYSGILLLVSYASSKYGSAGIYISSAISALTDIDAIAISVSKLGGTSIKLLTAQNAVLLATLSNTAVKIGIALWEGSKDLKKNVIFGYGLIFIAGIIGFLILNR